jgi:hypothetical protein
MALSIEISLFVMVMKMISTALDWQRGLAKQDCG